MIKTVSHILILSVLISIGLSQDSSAQVSNIKTMRLKENYLFKIRLPRKQSVVAQFQLPQKTEGTIILDITSTAVFEMCVLDKEKNCLEDMVKYHKKQNQIKLEVIDIKNGIRLLNPSILLKTKLKIKYHLIDEKCHWLQVQELHRKELTHSNCFQFELKKEEDGELLIKKQTLMSLTYEFTLCDSIISRESNQKGLYSFEKSLMLQKCDQKSVKLLRIVITDNDIGDKTTKTDKGSTAEVIIALQYESSPILLPDGLAYTTYFSQQTSPKLFVYELVNMVNTSINVASETKIQIYVKIVKQSQKDNTIPTSDNYDFSSKAGKLFTYFKPFIMIPEDKFGNFNCQDCYLVVAIQTQMQIFMPVTIEITQSMSMLVNGQIKHHFLQGGSFAYYEYTPKINSNVVYDISDNDKNCANMFLNDQMMPGPLNYLTSSLDGQVDYKSEANKVYYIAVYAVKDCLYSLVASDQSNGLVRLETGKFGALNMNKQEIKYFTIKNEAKQFIKLLSLHVYGRVEIYLNKTTADDLKKFSKQSADYNNFQMKGQFMNRLILTKDHDLFCVGCYYLIAVVAQKLTKSTLFYGHEHTPVPIRDKVINDMILNKGEVVAGEYYGQDNIQLQVKVHSGRMKLTIGGLKNTFSKEYPKSQQIDRTFVDMTIEESLLAFVMSFFQEEPVMVGFKAMEDNTVYSVRFKKVQKQGKYNHIDSQFHDHFDRHDKEKTPIPEKQSLNKEDNKTEQRQGNKSNQTEVKQKSHALHRKLDLQPGHSQYFSLEQSQQVCLLGFLRDKTQKILFSCSIDQKEQLSNLSFTFKGDDKYIQYKVQYLQNILTLSFPSLVNYQILKGIHYKLCVMTNSIGPVWLTVMQSEDFSLLPAEVDTVVMNQYTFVTHSQTSVIVDIFDCRGKSAIMYDETREKLNEGKDKKLDIVGLSNQPHAVRINKLSTTFYKVTSELAIIRWFPMDIERGIGTGYLDYQIGMLRYQSGMFGVKMVWQGLSKDKKVESQLVDVKHTVYISSSAKDLQSGSHCQSYLNKDTWQFYNIIQSIRAIRTNQKFVFEISKKDLVSRFGANTTLYSTVVIDVMLTVNQDQIQPQSPQRYRFIYPQVQIPGEIVNTGLISNLQYSQIITILLLSVAVLAIFVYVCSRKILPMLGILKNRYLIEENQQMVLPPENKVVSEAEDDLVVPPSSEREGVQKFNEMVDRMENQQNQQS